MSYLSSQSKAMQQAIKARVRLTMAHPFFGALAMRLKFKETTMVPVVGTDGECIYINPHTFVEQKKEHQEGLFAHEIMHVVFMHHLRKGNRDHEKWNIAGDLVINDLLKKEGFKLPEWGVFGGGKFLNYTTEHVYSLLPDAPVRQIYISMGGKSENTDEGNDDSWPDFGTVLPSPKLQDNEGRADEGRLRQLEQECKINISQAANVAKQAGKLPASMEKLVTGITETKIDWKEKTRQFVTKISYDKHNWMRPNRRFMMGGIIWPSMFNNRVGKVCVVVDTSGSISHAEYKCFFGEINAILEDANPEEIEIMYVDTRIANMQTITPDDLPIDSSYFKIKGGGGTSFVAPFEYYDQEDHEPPECLIYLTDMYGSFPGEPPEYPTLWVSTTNVDEAPFGEVVQIEVPV